MSKKSNETVDVSKIEEKKTIEEWQQVLSIKKHIFDGAVVYSRWLPNKKVTEAEFRNAINKFLKGE
jgi:hypothetical protein